MVMLVVNWFPHNHYAQQWGTYQIRFILDTDGQTIATSVNESTFIPSLLYPDDNYMEEETGSLSKCCGNYKDIIDNQIICRSCKKVIRDKTGLE